MNIQTIPLADDNYQTSASLTTYFTDNQSQVQPALVFVPGGSYTHISLPEAEKTALYFAEHGFSCFILRYSFVNEKSPLLPSPLIEIAKSLKLIRHQATEWQVDPDKIVVMGFSVGGHLISLYNNFWHAPWLAEAAGATSAEMQPNAVILGYPVIDSQLGFPNSAEVEASWTDDPSYYAAQKHVHSTNAPTFLWATDDDPLVPSINSIEYSLALSKQHVPQEFHLFHHGPHGLNLATEATAKDDAHVQPHVAHWTTLVLEWLAKTI